jgi:glucosamine--fructose-6-phosphate aminotransferase (isomerizing)
MCGISAILSKNNINISSSLFDSIMQLQNRGYDSLGFCFNSFSTLNIHKKSMSENDNAYDFLSNFDTIEFTYGMAHTRWATHGSVTDFNSHPHLSFDKKVAIVHNGIIENYKYIKEKYLSNVPFNSDTDSEVISNLIAINLQKTNDFYSAIQNTINILQGTYGLCIMFSQSNDIFVVRNGSPLLIGENDDSIYVTSEISGFYNKINNYIALDSNDIISISTSGIKCNKISSYKLNTLDTESFDMELKGFDHWTIKEIFDQSNTIRSAFNYGGRIRENKVCLGGLSIIKNAPKNLILLGCGTSLHACQVATYYFKKFKYFENISFYDGAEFSTSDFIENSVVIFVSQSGETKDLINCLNIIKDKDCISIGVINCVDSFIAREVDCGVYLNAMREVAVASTKSFTSSLIVLYLIAIWFQQENLCSKNYHSKSLKDLVNLPNQVSHLLNNNNIPHISKILNSCHSLFILGKGKMQYIAKEAALKFKEITYIHTEGYGGSSLKHGPFALLTKNTPVIFIIDSENIDKMYNSYEEVKSRGCPCIILSNIQNKNDLDNYILVPTNNNFQEILFIIALQLLSYHLSCYKNINPDKPRNLAKVVTVD